MITIQIYFEKEKATNVNLSSFFLHVSEKMPIFAPD